MQSLQTHLIKTVVGSVVSGILVALITGFSFYYKTSASIEKLSDDQKRLEKVTIEHAEKLYKLSVKEGITEVDFKNLKDKVNSIEETQKEMYSLLLNISYEQKTILKKIN